MIISSLCGTIVSCDTLVVAITKAADIVGQPILIEAGKNSKDVEIVKFVCLTIAFVAIVVGVVILLWKYMENSANEKERRFKEEISDNEYERKQKEVDFERKEMICDRERKHRIEDEDRERRFRIEDEDRDRKYRMDEEKRKNDLENEKRKYAIEDEERKRKNAIEDEERERKYAREDEKHNNRETAK